VFQALNLRQQDGQGRLLWRVSSPEARYDLSRHLAQARQLRGEIHVNGQALYRLLASHGTVINDGQVIQLEGDVRIERFGPDPVTIRASRMRWYPQQQRIELDRRAEASNPQLLLQAQRATLLLAQDRLELRGQPRLQRRPSNGPESALSLRVNALDWSPGNGRLTATGPVMANGLGSGAETGNLQASSLSGNTLQRRLELQAPVMLSVPERRAWLKAQQTVINLNDNSVSSAAPFTAAVGALNISGQAFDLALDQQLVTLPSGCRLVQADANLDAGNCRWNWQSQTIQAGGGVVLRRPQQQQQTRAASLSGRLGPDGLLILRAPGSKVRSTLRLPRSSPGTGTQAGAIRL
jgi:lipopolysaccharide export system protein LptC